MDRAALCAFINRQRYGRGVKHGGQWQPSISTRGNRLDRTFRNHLRYVEEFPQIFESASKASVFAGYRVVWRANASTRRHCSTAARGNTRTLSGRLFCAVARMPRAYELARDYLLRRSPGMDSIYRLRPEASTYTRNRERQFSVRFFNFVRSIELAIAWYPARFGCRPSPGPPIELLGWNSARSLPD